MRPIIGSIFTALIGLVFGRQVLGLGFETIQQTITGNSNLKEGIFQFFGKIFSTVFTVASGNSGGLVGPALFIGSALGNIMGSFCPVEHAALVVSGMASLLASTCNVPIASTVIISEIFGGLYIVPAVVGGVIGFIIGKPFVVYDYLNNSKPFGFSD